MVPLAGDLREQIECFRLARGGVRDGGRQIEAAHGRVAGTRVPEFDAPCGALRRLLRTHARLDLGVGLERAVGGLRQCLDLLDRDVAGDDHDGVVGRVEALVEGERVLARELGHLVHPADDGDAVGMVLIERRRHLLREEGGGVVLGARSTLLEDHLALGRHLLLGEPQVHHAVGFHGHDGLEPVLRDALEVAGHVVTGERVVLAAEARDDLGELAGGDLVRRLEHQVLEKVSDARHARGLIGRADAVPHVVGDDRRAMVGDDDHLQSVGELELGDPAGGRARVQRFEALDEHREG